METGPGTDELASLVFSISPFKVNDTDLFTKTTIDGSSFLWAADDTIGIYPNIGGQVYFVMSTGAGSNTAQFDGGGWGLKTTVSYYSYYPFIGTVYLDRNHIPVSYLGQKQTGTSQVDHIGRYDYMYAPGSNAESGQIQFTYKHLNCIIRFRLVLPAGTYTKLMITAPTEAFPIKGYYDLMDSEPVIIPTEYSDHLSIDLEDITLASQTEFYVYLMSAPVNLKSTEITVSVINDQKTELQCKKTPSKEYKAETINGLGCEVWTEVPQSVQWNIEAWDTGDSINEEI